MARQAGFFEVDEPLQALLVAGNSLRRVDFEPFRSNPDAALIGSDRRWLHEVET